MIDALKKSPVNFAFYVISLVLCFFVFKQGDLTHTYTSSYAYLNGHFYDFYDYNRPHMVRNDYLPLMYAFFALWNLPLKLLGLLTPVDMGIAVWQLSTPLEIMWSKLLLSIFFLGCVVMLVKIARLIHPDQRGDVVSPGILFATSPIAIFAVFIFSQYDVIGVFFTLIGVYFYFQKKFLRFAFFFSIAISFKYFACFIYLPLVLIIEKRPLHLIKYGFIGIFVTALQIGAYWHSDVFQASFFALAGDKTGEAMHRGKAIYIALLYMLLCGYAYFSKIKLALKEPTWAASAVLICTLAYGLMFSLVRWHPQWLLILMPFFALSILYIRHQKALIALEVLAYIAFIWLCVNGWAKNVDVTMVQEGSLNEFIPTLTYFGADVLSPKGESLARAIFYIYLFSPFLFWLYENRALVKARLKKWMIKAPVAPQLADAQVLSSGSEAKALDMGRLCTLRILVGGYFFLAITLICLYRSS